jgi:hypothetical protein
MDGTLVIDHIKIYFKKFFNNAFPMLCTNLPTADPGQYLSTDVIQRKFNKNEMQNALA